MPKPGEIQGATQLVQQGIVAPAYGLDIPKNPYGGSASSRKSSSKPSIDFADMLKGGEAPIDLKGFTRQRTDYYRHVQQVENERKTLLLDLQMMNSQYGGDTDRMYMAHGREIKQKILDHSDKHVALLDEYDAVAGEYERYEKSQMKDMDNDAVLYDQNGDPYTIAMFGELPEQMVELAFNQGYYGQAEDDEDGNPQFYEMPMTKKGYLQLLDQLPRGYTFTDIEGKDENYFKNQRVLSLKGVGGATMTGTDNMPIADRRLISLDGDNVRLALEEFYFKDVTSSPSLSRTFNANYNEWRMGARMKYNSFQGAEASVIEELSKKYETMKSDRKVTAVDAMFGIAKEVIPDGVTNIDPWDIVEYSSLANPDTITENQLRDIYLYSQFEQDVKKFTDELRPNPDGYSWMKIQLGSALTGGYDKFETMGTIYSLVDVDAVSEEVIVPIGKSVGGADQSIAMASKVTEYKNENDEDPWNKAFFSDSETTVDGVIFTEQYNSFIDSFLRKELGTISIGTEKFKINSANYETLNKDIGERTSVGKEDVGVGFSSKKTKELNTADYNVMLASSTGAAPSGGKISKLSYASSINMIDASGNEVTMPIQELMRSTEFQQHVKGVSGKELKDVMNYDSYVEGYVNIAEGTDIEGTDKVRSLIEKTYYRGVGKPVTAHDIDRLAKGLPMFFNDRDLMASDNVKFFDPFTLKETNLPTDVSALTGWKLYTGLNKDDPKKAYLQAYVSMTQEQAELFTYTDDEGVSGDYTDIYGDEYDVNNWMATHVKMAKAIEKQVPDGMYRDPDTGELTATHKIIPLLIEVTDEMWRSVGDKFDIIFTDLKRAEEERLKDRGIFYREETTSK